jgi:hypothetical protein
MSTPANYSLALYVDGVNIITHCPYEAMDLDLLAHDPSTFSFTIEDASGISIAQNMQVLVYSIETSPVELIFNGLIMAFRQRKRDNGLSIEYDVDCEDQKVRLQKSVLPYKDYEGLDSDILDDLINDVYPSLGDYFDFSELVNSFADDLSLNVNDDNLLDKLKELAEQAGANYRFETGDSGEINITFDADGWGEPLTALEYSQGKAGFHFYDGSFPELSSAVTSGGNPDNCAKWTDNGGNKTAGNVLNLLEINLGGDFDVSTVEFDYRVFGTTDLELICEGQTQAIAGVGAWHTTSFTIDASKSIVKIGFRATANINLSVIALDLRFDNIRIVTGTPVPDGTVPKDKLVWDSEADPTDYDFDIDLGDEFGSDFNLDVGGFDDFNSIIVTGGKTEHAIAWTYHSNAIEQHLGLELPVKDIAVYKNTGSFGAPVWTALSVGQWGVDKLNNETGGTKEVLYDTVNHWLYFDAVSDMPPNLENAIKVEGFILRPIRVKVENVTGDEPVFATTMYDESITSEDMAAQIGFSELAKRKALRQMTLKTHHPGLKVGQKLSISDSARGLDESLIIQRLHVTWKNNIGCFEAECGNAESSNASVLIANNDKRSRQKAAPAAIGTTSASLLTDEAGNILLDEACNQLYTLGN